jgi:glycosyltransferase involved in cell wall biosynthesis
VTRVNAVAKRAADFDSGRYGLDVGSAVSQARSLRILHVIDSGGLYGAERVLLTLGSECKRLGHEIFVGTIVAPQDEGDPLGEAAVRQGLEHITFHMRDGVNIRGLREILAFAREHRIDVIHSHGYKANVLLALAPRWLRPCAMVCTLHGWTAVGKLSKMSGYEWLEKRLVGRFDSVVVVSEAIRDRLPRSRTPVRLVRNGISNPAGMTGRPPASAKVPGEPALNILTAGRLSHEKGYDLLIRAVASLKERGTPVAVTIAGEGSKRAELEQQIADAGLSSQVRLPGYIDKLDSLFHEADVFVLCSRTEGLPMVLLEAMGRGVPVIATAVGQVPEVLGHGECGRLVPPGDSEALAEAIRAHVDEPPQRVNDMIERAFSRVGREYSAAAMSSAYCDVYRGCLRVR